MKALHGWNEIALDSVIAEMQSGSRPTGGASSDHGDIPSLGGENIIASGGVTLHDVKLVPFDFYTRMTKGHLQHGDVLINKDGAQTGKVGYYQAPNESLACINEHLFLMRGKGDQIGQEYLYYCLLSQSGQNQIRVQISGSAQPGLKAGFIKGIVICLPNSLYEQAKIAKILSTVDRAIEQTESLIAKQQRIKTGLMHDLLTRGIDEHGNLRSEETHQFKDSPLGRIPAEWEVQALSSSALIKGGKRLPPGHGYAEGDTGYRYLQTTDFINKQLNYNTLHHLFAKTFRMLERYEIIDGDVFISIAGVNLGVAGIFCPDFDDRTILTENAARIHILTDALPEYLAIQINGPLLQRQILEAKGIGAGVPKLALFRIQQLLVAWPCMEEQQRIVRRLQSVNSFIQKHRKELGKMQSLKTALMQDLLTGKVRVTPLMDSTEVMSE